MKYVGLAFVHKVTFGTDREKSVDCFSLHSVECQTFAVGSFGDCVAAVTLVILCCSNRAQQSVASVSVRPAGSLPPSTTILLISSQQLI